ncbi:hypothetical protein CEXT_382191 [Caerostris extrusa]|uniref:Uncharacterized protein n=1 Tax=Caerostris extrusa TaxID=172846 RepID=A0AAV4N9L0_CAEEX|nr:hypothetical protein CEXT_382191 [Caerostris extrusa]
MDDTFEKARAQKKKKVQYDDGWDKRKKDFLKLPGGMLGEHVDDSIYLDKNQPLNALLADAADLKMKIDSRFEVIFHMDCSSRQDSLESKKNFHDTSVTDGYFCKREIKKPD